LYFVFAVNKQKKIVSRLNLALDAKNQNITLLNNENLHFTKNAFTEISSLLRIQSAKLTGPGKDLITGMQLRIETIGLLYRQLFVENTNQTKLDVLISAIANNTLDGLADYTVIRDFKLAPVTASKELALNLALIANEICINACKYAFSAKGQDRLALRLSMDDQSKLVLVFCDHGSGLPADVHWETSASFGLRLIRLLAQDSDAKMTVSNDNSSGLIYRFEIFIKNHNDSN
jgi:two-component sensor histidine kinase